MIEYTNVATFPATKDVIKLTKISTFPRIFISLQIQKQISKHVEGIVAVLTTHGKAKLRMISFHTDQMIA